MILTDFGFAASVADISESFIGFLEYGDSSGLFRAEVAQYRAWLRAVFASIGIDPRRVQVCSFFVSGLEGRCEISDKYARLVRVAFIADCGHLNVEYFTFSVDSGAAPGDLTDRGVVNSAIAAAVEAGYVAADPDSVDAFHAFLRENCGAV